MFEKLIESEPKGADFKDRRKYFMVSSVVVGIVFTSAIVVSIFAADYGLGTRTFELVEMIAPVAPDPVAPEMREPRPQPANSSASQKTIPTRQANIARPDEPPTTSPTEVSTTPNTRAARPKDGRFDFRPFDSDPGVANTSGRESGPSVPAGNGLSEASIAGSKIKDDDVSAPPPVVKHPAQKPPTRSLGVINGKASYLPKPVYSAMAKQVGAAGQVNVQVTIDEEGRVVSANALSGHPLLKSSAEAAARAARFSPTLLSGTPVKITGTIIYNFST